MESTRYERNSRVEWLNEKGDLHRIDGPPWSSPCQDLIDIALVL